MTITRPVGGATRRPTSTPTGANGYEISLRSFAGSSGDVAGRAEVASDEDMFRRVIS